MFRSLLSRVFARPSRPARRAMRRRPGLEMLEAREVPAVMTVNSLADTISANSVLTLREAISLNNGTLLFTNLSAAEKAQVVGTVGANDKINFSVAGTINLGSDLPTLTKKLTIEGPGADQLVINGGDLHRPLNIGAAGDVTVSRVRLTAGYDPASGGAVLNNGKLRLTRVEIDHCKADSHGGAIENNGTLFVDECFIHDNQAGGVGGAIDNNEDAAITDTTISNNKAGNNGGGIWTNDTLILANSTMTGNEAVNYGGAIRSTSGFVSIVSSTIVGNKADTDGSGFEGGGGISNDGATLTLDNTIVTGNERDQGTEKSDIEGTGSGSYNFIGVNTALSGITNGTNNNHVGTAASPLDPMLGTLTFSGGLGPTFTPLAGSPVLTAGAPSTLAGKTDQRGTGRRSEAGSIGAVQVNNPLSPVGVPGSLYGPGPVASSNEAFIKALYRACLLRDADAGGLAAWMNFLNGHPERRSQVVNGFYNSTENRSNQVTYFYRNFLNREPDAQGLQDWVNYMQAGANEAEVVRGFILSPEYTGQNNNAQFVTTLYYALLGRNAEAAGFAAWKNALDNGTLTRAQAADQFLRAPETIQRVVTSYYQSYLNTEPSATTLTLSTAAIQAGFTFGSIAELVLGSQEFYNNGLPFVGV